LRVKGLVVAADRPARWECRMESWPSVGRISRVRKRRHGCRLSRGRTRNNPASAGDVRHPRTSV